MTEKWHCDELTFVKLKKRLAASGELKFNIATDSMSPLIAVGDEITVGVMPEEILPFDIIVFWTGENLMAHFVWHKNRVRVGGKASLLTRSIKNPLECDPPVLENHILGVVKNFKVSTLTRVLISFKCLISGNL